MIIWSRWGIVAFLFALLGFVLGFVIAAALGRAAPTGLLAWGYIGVGLLPAAVGLFFFDKHVVQKHLDKPRPIHVTRALAEPYTHPDGRVQTHEVVPAVDGSGQPILARPSSTLFFIPIRFWPFILAGLGVVLIIVNAVVLGAA